MEFSVLTYNIHSGLNAQNKYDLEAIIGVLKASGAQVIALQEVNRNWAAKSNWDDQVNILSNALAMNAIFGASLSIESESPSDGKRGYGNLILSKFPIKESHVHKFYINDDPKIEYEGTSRSEPRSLIDAIIDIGRIQIRVFCTHLSVHSQQERLAQIKKIEKILKENKLEKTLLLGDLNAEPNSEELVILTRYLRDSASSTSLITKPDRRTQIDFILTSGVEVKNVEVIDSDASDHRPLKAVLSIGK